MSVPGFKCLVRKSGASTPVVDERLDLVAGTTSRYQISSAARRALDPVTLWHLEDGTTSQAFTDIQAIDFAFGDFLMSQAASGTLSFTGNFLPLQTSAEIITECKGFTVSESSDLLDTTVFTSTSPFRRRIYGLADATASLDLLMNATDMPSLATLQTNANMLLLEINMGSTVMFRGYGKLTSLERKGSVDGLVEVTTEWVLAAERDDATGFAAGYSFRSATS